MECVQALEGETAQERQQRLQRCTFPSIIMLTILGLGISVLCLSFGYNILFQNVFYLPIILTCICYTRYGILYTSGLSLVYFALMMAIPRDPALIVPALIRIVFFELVAVVIVHLSNERSKMEQELEHQRYNLSRIIEYQTAYISDELAESHRLEKAYRTSNEYYENILDQLAAAVLIWNPDGYITHINPAFTSLVSRPQNDLIGRKLTTLPFLSDAVRARMTSGVILRVPVPGSLPNRVVWNINPVHLQGSADPVSYIAIGQVIPDTEAADFRATETIAANQPEKMEPES
jgi:PAS domain-containing protein